MMFVNANKSIVGTRFRLEIQNVIGSLVHIYSLIEHDREWVFFVKRKLFLSFGSKNIIKIMSIYPFSVC